MPSARVLMKGSVARIFMEIRQAELKIVMS